MIDFIYNKISSRIYQKTWEKKYAPQLAKFKNIHSGEDCFIIGNGPSLNKMNLSLLNDYYTFGLNKIYMIFEKNPFILTYHIAVNSLVIDQIKENIKLIECPSFLANYAARKSKIKSSNIYYLGDSGTSDFFYKDIQKGIVQGWTVTYVAMQIAYYMGFKRVFLIGVDHNFVQSGSANEMQSMKGNDPNHFDPNYFKGQSWHLADLERSELSYLIAQHIYKLDNRIIYDATLNGKLEIFDKIDFEIALEIAKKKHS